MRPERRSDVIFRVVDGEVVILDRRHDTVHRLNATASFVWEHCDGNRTAEEIADLLAAEFPDARDQVLADVRHILAQFDRLGLLRG